jgi:3-oxoacyl-[acyl-carrier protein] reductase
MSEKKMHLSGKVAWVTGSSRGIGRAILTNLAKAGANVIIHGSGPDSPRAFNEGESVQAVAQDIEREYRVTCLPVYGDLTQESAVQYVVEQIHDKLKQIDILVNCAGGDIGAKGIQTPLAGKPEKNDAIFISFEDIRTVLDRNLLTCILCCRAVAPEMMARKSGKIINIGSTAGSMGREHAVIYATAKAAVNAYSRCLAVQLRPYNVNVNVVAPGDTVTERWKASRNYDQQKTVISDSLDRYGQPEEIAQVVEFLVSQQAAYISGQVLRVDGCNQPWPA